MRRRMGEQLQAPDIILGDLVTPITTPNVFDIRGFFELEKAEEAEAAENENTDESKEVRS